jgi:hypothetical protein
MGSLSGGVPATGGNDTVVELPGIDGPYQILLLFVGYKVRAFSLSAAWLDRRFLLLFIVPKFCLKRTKSLIYILLQFNN